MDDKLDPINLDIQAFTSTLYIKNGFNELFLVFSLILFLHYHGFLVSKVGAALIIFEVSIWLRCFIWFVGFRGLSEGGLEDLKM